MGTIKNRIKQPDGGGQSALDLPEGFRFSSIPEALEDLRAGKVKEKLSTGRGSNWWCPPAQKADGNGAVSLSAAELPIISDDEPDASPNSSPRVPKR